jgi:hypothetical protein
MEGSIEPKSFLRFGVSILSQRGSKRKQIGD